MVYTPLTIKAMKLAYAAHHGQTDKSGVPYIFHPYHVAEQMTDEFTTCVALLHDVVEDTGLTFKELEEQFPKEVLDALRLLTHEKGADYFEYVRAIKENSIAKAVKLADIAHNSDRDPADRLQRRNPGTNYPLERKIRESKEDFRGIKVLTSRRMTT